MPFGVGISGRTVQVRVYFARKDGNGKSSEIEDQNKSETTTTRNANNIRTEQQCFTTYYICKYVRDGKIFDL